MRVLYGVLFFVGSLLSCADNNPYVTAIGLLLLICSLVICGLYHMGDYYE